MKEEITRCHRCGTSKGEEDEGVWMAFTTNDSRINDDGKKTEYMVWFHSEEDKKIWLADYGEKVTIVG